MIDVTSFLLKHLYELMADNYNVATQQQQRQNLQLQSPELSPVGGCGDERPSDLYQVIEPTLGRDPAGKQPSATSGTHHCAISPPAKPRAGATATTPHTTASDQFQLRPSQDDETNATETTSTTSGRCSGLIASALCRLNYCLRWGRLAGEGRPSRDSGSAGTLTSREQEAAQAVSRNLLAREQETNQQIVAFLINNQLPDLACETLIELIFICVFLAVSWIFVMIVQLHCHQTGASPASPAEPGQHAPSPHESYQYARDFYCNTKFLNSLMYCNNRNSKAFSS